MELIDSISTIKGVGSQRTQIFNEFGIQCIKDILYYFPRRYLDRTTLSLIKELKKGDKVTLIAQIETFGAKRIRRGKMFQVIVSDGTGLLTLNWFNGVRYVKNQFKVGDKIAINGKVEWYNGFSITHPEFERLMDDEDPIETGTVVPVYPLTQDLKSAGLNQRSIRRMLKSIFSELETIPEIMPESILRDNDLIPLDQALRNIHFSSDLTELRSATKRLKFDEHFFLQILLALRKKTILQLGAKRLIDIGPYFRPISETLDFNLTKAQKRVIQDVHLDMKNDYPMNRLVQGDVGCGKTIVAILISSIAVGNNVQVAIMAPTEILARQHFHSFEEQLNKVKITCSLLVGKMRKSERDKIISGLKNGEISIVVGTHALIQKDVIEEHRNDYLGWEQTGMSKKVYGKPFEPSILKKRCSNVISYPIKWNRLKVDWKLILG